MPFENHLIEKSEHLIDNLRKVFIWSQNAPVPVLPPYGSLETASWWAQSKERSDLFNRIQFQTTTFQPFGYFSKGRVILPKLGFGNSRPRRFLRSRPQELLGSFSIELAPSYVFLGKFQHATMNVIIRHNRRVEPSANLQLLQGCPDRSSSIH